MKTLVPRASLLAAAMLLTSAAVHAIGTAFTFQGALDDAGVPASGSYDLQFTLLDAAGAALGAPIAREDVEVQRGLFAVELDFGSSAFQGDARSLRIAVRPGASPGAYTTLVPDTKVLATPYAQVAEAASFAASVADGSVGTAALADQGVTAADVAPDQVQLRVAQSCAAGTAIRSVGIDGTVACEPVSGGAGDITAVRAGMGLTGGGGAGDVTLAVAVGGIDSSLIADGQVGSADINALQVQRRVSGSCTAGSSIRTIAQDGAVTCESDDVGVASWALGGNSGTTPLSHFVGTSDAQPLEFRTGNERAWRLELGTDSVNVTAFPRFNVITPGVRGGTISGGGFSTEPNRVTDHFSTVSGGSGNVAGDGDATLTMEMATVGGGRENVASGNLSTSAGGYRNIASGVRSAIGGGASNDATAWASTVAGGEANTASGSHSTVGGGAINIASGTGATIPGGNRNTAGGAYSFAAGSRAKVRTGAETGETASCPGDPNTCGDEGTFVWADRTAADFVSSGPDQFLLRARGGVGINTNAVAGATLSVAASPTGTPLVRIFDEVADQAAGGRVLLAENGATTAGGYIDYDAFNNLYNIGTNSGSADTHVLRFPRGAGRVGVLRIPTANALEVQGEASKSVAGSWVANSDARIKTDIAPIPDALDTLMRLRPVTFRYTDAYRAEHTEIDGRRYYNVVAQEFAEVFPDAVKGSGEIVPGEQRSRDTEILQVDTHPATITHIAATQELAARVEALTKRIAELERELARRGE